MRELIDVLRGKDLGWWALTFAILAVLVFFGWYCLQKGLSIESIGVVIGLLVSKLNTLIDFKYGSSKGSKEKTELLNQKNANDVR